MEMKYGKPAKLKPRVGIAARTVLRIILGWAMRQLLAKLKYNGPPERWKLLLKLMETIPIWWSRETAFNWAQKQKLNMDMLFSPFPRMKFCLSIFPKES